MSLSVTKICRKCQVLKELAEYRHGRSGCKACDKKYREENKAQAKTQKKQYYIDNKEHITKIQREYVQRNPDKVKQTKKSYRQKNRDKINAFIRRWGEENKEQVRVRRREQRRRRKQTDLHYKISCHLRTSLYRALKGHIKSGRTISLLGCSVQDFIAYLESKFENGMTWTNWGSGHNKWNLDHILPVSSFDMKEPEHQQRCYHWTNFQPLWWKDNMDKSNKLNWSKPVIRP